MSLILNPENNLLYAFVINLILISLVQKTPVLTKAGWVHAGSLGTILLYCLGWSGWLSVVAYLILGSLVTRYGFKKKAKASIEEKRGGKRGPENLWGSAATGAFLALLVKLSTSNEKLLLVGFAASFAAKLADTFGSEIGKVLGTNAYSITTFKKVSPGTEGAVSFEGLVASLIGSLFMTVVMIGLQIIDGMYIAYVVLICGFVSTLCESILGDFLQRRNYIISNEGINALQTSFAGLIAICIANTF